MPVASTPSGLPTIPALTLPQGAPICSPFRWFHVPLAQGTGLPALEAQAAATAPIGGILRWLIRAGGRHRLELRMAAAGPHAGLWLGIAGVDATARGARRTADAAFSAIREVLPTDHGLQFPTPPPLPAHHRNLAGASIGHRIEFEGGLLATTRHLLPDCAGASDALVLQLRLDLSALHPELVEQAEFLRRRAKALAPSENPILSLAQPGSPPPPAERAARLRDEAAGLRMWLRVHADRWPSPLRMTMLTEALDADLGGCFTWSRSLAVHPARFQTLIHLLSALAFSADPAPEALATDDVPF